MLSYRKGYGEMVVKTENQFSCLRFRINFSFLQVVVLVLMMFSVLACGSRHLTVYEDSPASQNSQSPQDSQSPPVDPLPIPSILLVTTTNDLGKEDGNLNAGFSVVLKEIPSSDVTVRVTSSDDSEGIPAVSTLTFTPDNWDATQDIEITSQDDSVLDYAVAYDITFSPSVGEEQVFRIYNLDNEYTLPGAGQAKSYAIGDGIYHKYHEPKYTINSDGTVTDENSGLIWQRQDDGVKRNWDQAKAYCTNLGSKWHLPNEKELAGIANYGTHNPAIDSSIFPGTHSKYYWSSRVNTDDTSEVWCVNFRLGYLFIRKKNSDYYVRCVKTEPSVKLTNRFVDLSDKTTLDRKTGLNWQRKCCKGRYAPDTTWPKAIEYCQNLSLAGKSDWRLPDVRELESISDDSVDLSKIKAMKVISIDNSLYWSSTSLTLIEPYVFVVQTSINYIYVSYKKFVTYRVRCVRGGE